jgi:hypothetical protein
VGTGEVQVSRVDDVKLSEFSVLELEELSTRIAKELVIAKRKRDQMAREEVREIEELALRRLKGQGYPSTR